MASKQSRFSTLNVFKFTSSKPPPPPPKDPNYLYSSSINPSLISISSANPPHGKPSPPAALSVRCPSPAPSRSLQQSPPHSISTSTPSPDPNRSPASTKSGFFRKISTFRKRSASKSSRVTNPDDATDDEGISRPWNFQHHIHVDEAFRGIPPAWSSTLTDLGYSEAEIYLIQQGRRNRVPPSSATPSRSQSPALSTAVISPRPRSSSLRRQKSDGSIARSERSLRIGPPPPPPPLPLPPTPHTPETPNDAIIGPAAPPPTPASGVPTSNDIEDVATHQDAQYVYINQPQPTPDQSVPVPAPVPAIQSPPVRSVQPSRSNSVATTHSTRSRSADRERRFKPQTPPRRSFRVVNETPSPPIWSPPPRYTDDAVSSGSPPSITLDDAVRPPPQEKAQPSPPPSRRLPDPPSPNQTVTSPPPDGAIQEEADGVEEQGRGSTERRRLRPSDLSILPPRLSLRKDTLEDLSSWSDSLFSSIPSGLRDGPELSASTAATSVPSSNSEPAKYKPSVTLPSIVLGSELWEEDEGVDVDVDEGEEAATEQDYSYSASPLYHELMGMMQERAAVANNITPNSTSIAGFQLDPAWSASGDVRDSQLTIRYDPRRDSNRDSSASSSTITHATIVRGASFVRRVRADVVTTAPSIATPKGKEREYERPPVQAVQEDDEDDSSSDDDATSSDEEDGTSGSISGTLAFTSAPNSQEDAGGRKSPQVVYLYGSPLPSPSPSPLRASFLESDLEQVLEEIKEVPTESPYVTPPPSAPVVPVRRPPIPITTTNVEKPNAASSSISTQHTNGQEKKGVVPQSFASSTGAARYPAWLAAVVLPLSEFIDDAADPHALFTDLQEIAQGESGSVYSARAAPLVVQQFRPPTPRSPTPRSSMQDSKESTHVAIKRIPLVRGGTPKLVDLRRELELARALRHANVLRMERLYVDVVEESLWIGMELMDRSLADVLAVVGEEPEVGAGAPVEISEKMVARFVWDVLLALSYIGKHHIAHRDVRSDNLLLSRSGVLKLSDFSTAVCSPLGTPKRSDPVGIIYWQAPEMRVGLYDPLKVDVWSLGATAWELVHGDPPFSDVQDPRLPLSRNQLPPVRQPEALSRSFHDFLHLCSQPAASRPDADELLNAYFIRTACPRSEIVQLLGQCKAIDEQQLLRKSFSDSDS